MRVSTSSTTTNRTTGPPAGRLSRDPHHQTHRRSSLSRPAPPDPSLVELVETLNPHEPHHQPRPSKPAPPGPPRRGLALVEPVETSTTKPVACRDPEPPRTAPPATRPSSPSRRARHAKAGALRDGMFHVKHRRGSALAGLDQLDQHEGPSDGHASSPSWPRAGRACRDPTPRAPC